MGLLAATAALITASPGIAAPVQYYASPAFAGAPAPFSKAVRVGDVLYFSAVIGRSADGKVTGGIDTQTRAAMDDIGATLNTSGSG